MNKSIKSRQIKNLTTLDQIWLKGSLRNLNQTRSKAVKLTKNDQVWSEGTEFNQFQLQVSLKLTENDQNRTYDQERANPAKFD